MEIERIGIPDIKAAGLRDPSNLSALMHKIGHEIGNPLTAIISMATVLNTFSSEGNDSTVLNSKIAQYSIGIIDEAWRISRMNEQLVMLLSNQPCNAYSCDLKAIAQKALFKLRSRNKKLGKAVHASFEPNDAWPAVLTDEVQLMLVFRELFSNAAEAHLRANEAESCVDKTQAHSKTQKSGVPVSKIQVSARKDTDMIYLTVSSVSSIRCPFELSELFNPMITGDSDNKRVGLGLPVCLAIVDRMGGNITITERMANIENDSAQSFKFSVELCLPCAE